MMRHLLMRTVLVSVAMVLASMIGWWAIPVAGAVFGALTYRDSAGPVVAGFGAIIAWSGLLMYDAIRGPVSTVAATVGAVLQTKPIAVYLLTLAFAGLLGICSALVSRTFARFFARVRERGAESTEA
jgi:hypothetical protein